MDIADMIADIRKHPDFRNVGMLLAHNGVVRETSRERPQRPGIAGQRGSRPPAADPEDYSNKWHYVANYNHALDSPLNRQYIAL
jgi:hypothetical protein